MAFLRYTIVIWMCLLVIAGIEAFSDDDTDEKGMLFFSVGSAIHKYDLGQRKDESIVEDALIRPVGVGVSAHPNIFYWSIITVGKKAILRTQISLFHNEIIVDTGLVAPEELAVDWVTGNLYFIDSKKRCLGVCTEDGLYCTILDTLAIDTPGGLVLNPKNGEMFWSDCGIPDMSNAQATISRAGMDGRHHTFIVSEDLGWPKGLAIDYSKERLYWIDSKFKTVESISLDGKDRQRLLQTDGKLLRSLAIFDEKLYWSDWETHRIESMDIATGDNRKIIVNASELIYDMEIYHSSLKPPLRNPCENHDCSEICLLALDHRYNCACKLGNVLNSDLHTCRPEKEMPHLVIAAGDKIIHYRDEIIGKGRIKETRTPIHITRMTYNRNTKSLIVDDQFTHSLFSFDYVNNEFRRITTANCEYLGGIDFNYKNNCTFWSVTSSRHIQEFNPVCLSCRAWTEFDEEPHEILSIPEYEKMFVVFKSKHVGFRIDWFNLYDQKTSRTIIKDLLGEKISLAYDERIKRLYFADEKAGTIEFISLKSVVCNQTIDRQVLLSKVEKPVSLAVLNDKLFWTTRDSRVLKWVYLYIPRDGIKNFEIESTILPIEKPFGILDIIVVGNITVENREIRCFNF